MQHIWTSFDLIHMNVNEVQLKSMHESENIQDIFINILSYFTRKNFKGTKADFLKEIYYRKCVLLNVLVSVEK